MGQWRGCASTVSCPWAEDSPEDSSCAAQSGFFLTLNHSSGSELEPQKPFLRAPLAKHFLTALWRQAASVLSDAEGAVDRRDLDGHLLY